MSFAAQPEASVIATTNLRPEVWLRRILMLLTVVAGLAMLCHFGVLLWAQNEFAQPESVVAAQSTMLAHDGTLYYSLRDYPYTVCAYMPIFYWLEAGLIRVGLPAFTAGRLISFAALLGILMWCWRLVLLYTKDRDCAWLGSVLFATTSVLLSWGTVAQVDTLALFFSIGAFYQYSRYAIRGENTLWLAGVFAIAAFMTKQTMIAGLAAICLALLLQRPKVAIKFGAAVGAILVVLVLGINAALHGRFLLNTVFANLNPFAMEKLNQHLHYMAIAAGQLVIVVAVGARQACKGPGRALYLYLGLALCVLGVTAPKIGSDSNYQMESTVLLILCACVALHSLDFFSLVRGSSRSWVTLLQLPLGIHMVLNLRLVEPFLLSRIVREQQFRQQVADLRHHVADGGRVLSTEINAMVHLRGRLEVEPLIYTLVTAAGRIDPEPLRRDLSAEVFSTVILYQDVNRPFDQDLELPTLPAPQIAEIRKHYKLVDHIAGPYLDGVFVYKPVGKGAISVP